MSNNQRSRNGWISACLIAGLIVSLGLFSQVARAEEEEERPINFDAIAQNLSNVGRRGQVRLQLRIDRWRTEEEREHLRKTLKDEGTRALTTELFRQDEVGMVREIQQLANPFRYARKITSEEGQMIIMATDRPLNFAEVWRGSRTRDYNVTIVILNLDNEGNGDGQIMMGTELGWDSEKDQIELTHFASEPVRLTRVTSR